MAASVRVLVDVQERRSGIHDLLAQLGAEVELVALPACEYALGADTIVELRGGARPLTRRSEPFPRPDAKAQWPTSAEELVATQLSLAAERPPPWRPAGEVRLGACFVCFERGVPGRGRAGDRAWAAAALGQTVAVAEGAAGAAYEEGLLALREGALLEAAVRALPERPEVLIVNATGADHPRRAGLAIHLGAVLDVPTVGVTHRALVASGDWPPDERGASSPLVLEQEVVGYWLRTRRGARPLAVHAAWRTDADVAARVVIEAVKSSRTPEPLRLARRAARTARSRAEP
jgi:deoxyribonuclease V